MRDAEIVIALLISRIKPSNYAVDRCARARARWMSERGTLFRRDASNLCIHHRMSKNCRAASFVVFIESQTRYIVECVEMGERQNLEQNYKLQRSGIARLNAKRTGSGADGGVTMQTERTNNTTRKCFPFFVATILERHCTHYTRYLAPPFS